MKKKILLIVPHLSTGGLPQFAVKKIEMLKNTYEIKCVEYSCISHDFIVQRNRIIDLLGEDNLITLGEDKGHLLNLMGSFRPDVVWMEEFPEFFMGRKIANSIYSVDRQYAIVETTHDSSFKASSKIWMPDKFSFVSVHNALTFYNLGIPYEVIEYPVDRKQVNKSEAMRKLGLDPGWKHVVNVGLFTARKNQGCVFELARFLGDKKIKFHFIGNQADNFKSYWGPLMENKPDNCIIWGERNDVDDFLEAADLFIFPSRGDRNNKELNPLSIKEALSNSLPIAMFDLDVYCGKYKDNKCVHFLNGTISEDSQKIIEILDMEKNQYQEISVSYDRKDNQITFFNNTNDSFKNFIVVKDMLSNHTIYSFGASFSPGSNSWCIPCPSDFFFNKVANANNFKGYVIDFYDESRCNLVCTKEILIDKYATNFSPTLYQNPFNASFMNYTEFFSKNYLDDYNMTDLEVFIDAGANDGLVTEWALKKGFRRIYSIEPDPRAISVLKNKFIDDEGVTIIEKAVYKYNQTGVRFDTNDDASTVTSMSLDPNKTGFPNRGYFLSETVRFGKLLSDYNIGDISVLKMDIEGAEYSVLSDFDNRWKKRVKHFLVELHSFNSERMGDVMKFFENDFYVQFRNHLNDNEEISMEEASKLEMVTLFATNTNLVPNFSKNKNIEVVVNHCLSLPDVDREVKSINSISKIKCDSYNQLINPPFEGLVPVDTCFRPNDISDQPGGNNLTKGHYGCYKAHADAIMKCEPKNDTAYVFFECDAVLCVDPDCFIERVKESYVISKKYGYYFFSYGPITNVEKEMSNHLTDTRMIEAHAYMIPGERIREVQNMIKQSKWDVFDLWVSDVLPPQRIGYFSDHLCLQAKGDSLIDLNESLSNHLGISKI